MSNLWLSFLAKSDLRNKFIDFNDVHENVERMTSEWLDFDIRYTSQENNFTTQQIPKQEYTPPKDSSAVKMIHSFQIDEEDDNK